MSEIKQIKITKTESKIKEPYSIAENWTWMHVEDCIDILDSKRIPVNAKERKNRVGKIPYYGATGQVGWIDDHLFDEELVLLGEDGAPFLERYKKKAYIISGKSWVNNHAHVLKAISNLISNSFLCHYLNFFDFTSHVTGTTRLKLNQSSMRKIPIPVPSIIEQNLITRKIAELFLKIDLANTTLKKIKSLSNRYKLSLLENAFNGNLSKTWRKKTLSKDNNNKIETTQLNSISKIWKKEKLETLCEIIGGGTPSRKVPNYFSGDIVWLTPTQIPKTKIIDIFDSKEKITKKGLEKSSAKLIPEGSVLLTSRATIGSVAIAGCEVTTNQGFASFVCTHDIFNKFLAYWLWANKDLLIKKARGTTFKEIAKSTLKQLDIPVPTIPEQKFIVNTIDVALSNLETSLNLIDKVEFQLIQQKYIILKSAFEGKLII